MAMEEIQGAGSFAGGVAAEFLERPPFGPDAEKTAGTGSVKPLKADPVRLAKPLNDRYRNLVFEGSTFPDDPYRIINIRLNETIRNIYLPAMQKAIAGESKGLKLLITAMTHQEGFTTASRSFRTNNPGNVGNTDSGANKVFKTLEEGIKAQAWHIRDIADGIRDSSDKVDSERYYPIGTRIYLPPFESKEIRRNPGYGLPYNLPGYRFVYTGQVDQFVKIYSTGARATNAYINVIVSWFRQNGVAIGPETTLAEIIKIN